MKVLGEMQHALSADTIPLFIQFVSSCGKEHGQSANRIREIESAVYEALDNMIRFMHQEGELEVTITGKADERGRLILEISDGGKPFNMLLGGDSFISGSLPEQERPSVRVMKKLIRNVDYIRHEGRNCLTLTVMPDFKTAGTPAQ
ncbi:MAG: hypothetical protein C0392_09880 [Syntrophus sp. (in: bacteria)]|nr:hypothetical protein [Syntrophus sp. (in: bacteria)]